MKTIKQSGKVVALVPKRILVNDPAKFAGYQVAVIYELYDYYRTALVAELIKQDLLDIIDFDMGDIQSLIHNTDLTDTDIVIIVKDDGDEPVDPDPKPKPDEEEWPSYIEACATIKMGDSCGTLKF